jgi:polyisoprenoid-binding protein YceI
MIAKAGFSDGQVGIACACGLLLPILVPGTSSAAEYHVDTSRTAEVRFLSDAPIEDFEGTTHRIDGYVFWKGDSLAAGDAYDGSDLYFEVPLAAPSTGIDLRDRHMRENYLHTDRYPYVSYKGHILRIERGSGDSLRVVSSGVVELHGTKRNYDIVCDLSGSRTSYKVSAAFEIKLPDFEIEVPSLMFMKISEIIQVRVHFHVAPFD